MLDLHVLSDAEFAGLDEEWEDLLAASPTATPFQTPEWVRAWWRWFGRGRTAHAVTFRYGGSLVGLMPMYRTRGVWRALRTMGTGVSDYLDPLIRAGHEECVWSCLMRHFDQVQGIDLIDLHQIRSGRLPLLPHARTNPVVGGCPVQGAPEKLEVARDQSAGTRHPGTTTTGSTVFTDEDCYVLDLPATWEEYVASLSKSLRYEARRLDKPPYSTGEATVRTVTETPEVTRGLVALFDLHTLRWRKRGLPGVFALSRTKRFHQDYCLQALHKNRLRLSILESDGRIVGSIYAMSVNKTVFFYQSGFDPEAKALSPGTVLVAHSIRQAIKDGAEHFDFLRGAEPYKLRWQPQHCSPNLHVMIPLGLRGRMGEGMNVYRARLEAKIRTRLAARP